MYFSSVSTCSTDELTEFNLLQDNAYGCTYVHTSRISWRFIVNLKLWKYWNQNRNEHFGTVPKADYPRNEVISKTDRVSITPHLPYINTFVSNSHVTQLHAKTHCSRPVKLLHTHYVSYFTL